MSQARARARSSSAARVVAWAFGIAARPHTKCRHGARGGPRPPPRPGHKRQAGSSNAALAAIKVAHTLAWSSIESCMVYVLYAGFARRSDRKGRHGRRGRGRGEPDLRGQPVPLSAHQLAERLGAQQGSVTDIYLPGWFAHNLPAIHAPLIALAAFLHGRNLRQQRRRDRRSGCFGSHSIGPKETPCGWRGGGRARGQVRRREGSRRPSEVVRGRGRPSGASEGAGWVHQPAGAATEGWWTSDSFARDPMAPDIVAWRTVTGITGAGDWGSSLRTRPGTPGSSRRWPGSPQQTHQGSGRSSSGPASRSPWHRCAGGRDADTPR